MNIDDYYTIPIYVIKRIRFKYCNLLGGVLNLYIMLNTSIIRKNDKLEKFDELSQHL
jgi:hypothetical protein